MRTRLTPGFINTAKAADGAERTTFWDAAMPGFGLMVTANGARSYVVQYRSGRTSRRMTLKGGLPLTEARREAKAILGAVAKGRDPLQEARAARAAEGNTLKAVAEEYLAREGKKLRSPHPQGQGRYFPPLHLPNLRPAVRSTASDARKLSACSTRLRTRTGGLPLSTHSPP